MIRMQFAVAASCLVTACRGSESEACTAAPDVLEFSLLQAELHLVSPFSELEASHVDHPEEELSAINMPYGSFALLELNASAVAPGRDKQGIHRSTISRPRTLNLLELHSSKLATKGPPIYVWLILAAVAVFFTVAGFLAIWTARSQRTAAARLLQTAAPKQETSTVSTMGLPPPICEALILRKTEAQFLVSMEQLLGVKMGAVNLIGSTGKQLMTAVLTHEDGTRCLTLTSPSAADPRAFVFADENAKGQPPVLRICGSNRSPYGELEAVNDGTIPDCVLKVDGKEVMHFKVGNAGNLELSAQAVDGKVLASAGQDGRSAGRTPGGMFGTTAAGRATEETGSDPWLLQVNRGVDSVLVASCMLAMVTMLRQTSPFE